MEQYVRSKQEILHTLLNGCGHGLENTGDENLVFMALIIYD